MRPLRCSKRVGFHGKSKLISVPSRWRLRPSDAASVPRRSRISRRTTRSLISSRPTGVKRSSFHIPDLPEPVNCNALAGQIRHELLGKPTPEQKKRRFRELAKHDRIRTGRQLAEERERPFLSLFNDPRMKSAPARAKAAIDNEKEDHSERRSRARMEQLGLSIPDGAVQFYIIVAGTPLRYYAKCSLCDWISQGYEEEDELEQRVRRHEHNHHCRAG
jgi:hypothetical protein